MFVKCIQDGNTAIYECDRAFTRTLIDSLLDKTVLLTIINGKEEQVEIEIKTGVQVFIMNNEGKTIDRYRR